MTDDQEIDKLVTTLREGDSCFISEAPLEMVHTMSEAADLIESLQAKLATQKETLNSQADQLHEQANEIVKLRNSNEDAKELIQRMMKESGAEAWKERAEKLWGIMDDISTLFDMYHVEETEFLKGVKKRLSERHEVMYSPDGYVLVPTDEGQDQVDDEIASPDIRAVSDLKDIPDYQSVTCDSHNESPRSA